ncbi:carbohydrate ABC transporter permease [Pseudonocardia sp. TRM90224]|uniref:carbohydrate ABC transporter permease n=1 Tax=Pseudonocardia sp. TRM90224 TaxID=2812678 RepID=UPI001E37989A|nr:carbohydrate ABC transporter permease [Pseudonocardia sp. TRM90224]
MAAPTLTPPRQATRVAERRRSAPTARPRVPRAIAFVALALMAALWLLPLAWALVTSLKSETDAAAVPATFLPESGFTFESYANLFAAGDVVTWLVNSLVVATLVTVLTVAVSAMAGYGFSRTLFRGRRCMYAVTIAAIVVPPQILIVPLFREMLALNLVDTLAGIIAPQVVAPVMVYILKKFFDAVPLELEEAARIDGAGPWRIFWTIVLPLSRPVVAAVSIFVFIAAWNNFLWPFVVTTDAELMTLPVGLAIVKSPAGLQWALTMAGVVIAALPLLIVFMLFQRQIVRSVATTGLGGQ